MFLTEKHSKPVSLQQWAYLYEGEEHNLFKENYWQLQEN